LTISSVETWQKSSKKDIGNFGVVDVIFFTQLQPVHSKPIYLEQDFAIWDDWVHTFLELENGDKFSIDFEMTAPTALNVRDINKKRIGCDGGPKEQETPADVTYASKTNEDRMAINDAIFANHLRYTHSSRKSSNLHNLHKTRKASMEKRQ
jgi:hypothetical protein